jgi:hypothetical protein
VSPEETAASFHRIGHLEGHIGERRILVTAAGPVTP